MKYFSGRRNWHLYTDGLLYVERIEMKINVLQFFNKKLQLRNSNEQRHVFFYT